MQSTTHSEEWQTTHGEEHDDAFRKALPCAIPLLLALALLLGLCSCKQPEGKSPPKARAAPIVKEYRRGPAHVRLTVDKDVVSIAENLTLTLEGDVAEGYDMELPAFGEKLGDFGILDYREDSAQLTSDRRTLKRKTYRLDPFLSGDYVIAPMTVLFWEKGPQSSSSAEPAAEVHQGESAPKHELLTDEVKIKVESLLGEDRGQLQIEPLFGPVGLPGGSLPLWVVIVGLTAVLCAAAGFVYYRRRCRRLNPEATPVLPPHELAYRQLRELMEDKLWEQGEFKVFFARISDIARYYIESRFGLHAPKLTTEEFLTSIGRLSDDPLTPEHEKLLNEFLHRCDLVKFAEHVPTQDEIQAAIDACRAFIEGTRKEDGQT